MIGLSDFHVFEAGGDVNGLESVIDLRMLEKYNDDRVVTRLLSFDDFERSLCAAKNIEHLTISGFMLDEWLVNLGYCIYLKSLNLNQATISDKAIPFLRQLEVIESLDIGNTCIGDEGVIGIWKMWSIRHLSLSNTLITDAGILGMPLDAEYHCLDLSKNVIGDAAATHLSKVRILRELDLSSTRFTSSGVRELLTQREAGQVGHVQKLVLRKCSISIDEIGELRKRFPETEIEF